MAEHDKRKVIPNSRFMFDPDYDTFVHEYG